MAAIIAAMMQPAVSPLRRPPAAGRPMSWRAHRASRAKRFFTIRSYDPSQELRMSVLSDADRSVADTIALTLMRRAFLALAEAHIAFDPERGRGHLHELQKDAAATIREFFEQEPDEADARIFFDVALKLRGTLREALGLPDESDALAQAA